MESLAAYFHIDHWPPRPDLLFWIALVLLAGALLGGLVNRFLRLPRIVGYSAVGMLVATFGKGLGDGLLLGTDRLIVDLALALLLFELGSRVSLRWLRNNPVLLLTSILESALGFWAVFAVLAWFDFPPRAALAGSALLGVSSAAIVSRVATELKSAGQATERMLVFGALNTLYAVLLMKMVGGWLHIDANGDWVQGLAQPLYTFAGSAVVAALLAGAVAIVLRRVDLKDENTVLLLLGLVLLAVTAARLLALSTLLVPLLAGVLLRNTSERPCIWPRHFGTAGGVLVLMLFVIAGAAWSLPALSAGLLIAAVALLARALLRGAALVGLSQFSGLSMRQGLGVALGAIPISATSLVLLADLRLSHPALAQDLTPIALSAMALMALPGPVLVLAGLWLAGDYRQHVGEVRR